MISQWNGMRRFSVPIIYTPADPPMRRWMRKGREEEEEENNQWIHRPNLSKVNFQGGIIKISLVLWIGDIVLSHYSSYISKMTFPKLTDALNRSSRNIPMSQSFNFQQQQWQIMSNLSSTILIQLMYPY